MKKHHRPNSTNTKYPHSHSHTAGDYLSLESCLQQPDFHGIFCAHIKEHTTEGKQALLQPEELARLQRFTFNDDRTRYLLAHALKRACLSLLLNTPTAELQFSLTEKGKPICNNSIAVDFNLSHSGDWGIVGLSSLPPPRIGIDIEPRYRTGAINIAKRVLNQTQRQSLQTTNMPEERFMCYWTQKEAISKAMGLGLSANFKQISCTGEWGHSQAEYNGHHFHVFTLPLENNYIISTAAGTNKQPSIYQITTWDSTKIEVKKL